MLFLLNHSQQLRNIRKKKLYKIITVIKFCSSLCKHTLMFVTVSSSHMLRFFLPSVAATLTQATMAAEDKIGV